MFANTTRTHTTQKNQQQGAKLDNKEPETRRRLQIPTKKFSGSKGFVKKAGLWRTKPCILYTVCPPTFNVNLMLVVMGSKQSILSIYTEGYVPLPIIKLTPDPLKDQNFGRNGKKLGAAGVASKKPTTRRDTEQNCSISSTFFHKNNGKF